MATKDSSTDHIYIPWSKKTYKKNMTIDEKLAEQHWEDVRAKANREAQMITYQVYLVDIDDPIEILADDFEINSEAKSVCFIQWEDVVGVKTHLAYFPMDKIRSITYKRKLPEIWQC